MISEIITRKQFYIKEGCPPEDSVLIVLKGSFACRISGKSYEAKKNDIIIFPRQEHFERKVLEEIRCIYIKIAKLPYVLPGGIAEISDVIRRQNTIFYLEQAVMRNDEVLTEHFMNDIFIMIRESDQAVFTCSDEVVRACIDFMQSNCHMAVDLDMLAEKFHISKQWLIIKFKKTVECTPIDYLNRIRIGRAKTLLTDTDDPVGNIAVSCGFENRYYFSNAFKKVCGVSPSAYRKQFRL